MNIRLINKIISVFRELSPRRPRNYHCSSFSKRVYNKNRVRRRSFAYLNTIRRVWCVCVCVCIRACISTFSRLHSAVKFYIDSSIVCSYIFCVHAIYYVYFAYFAIFSWIIYHGRNLRCFEKNTDNIFLQNWKMQIDFRSLVQSTAFFLQRWFRTRELIIYSRD